MPYDFSRFSPQSFERFAQALTAKEFGPGVQIYGAGPDGAREASFEGKLPISTQGAQWDGYVVVQAKYRAVTKGGSDDAAWLEHELAADLEKFSNSSRNLKAPEYYLAITNVILTPLQSSGTSSAKGGQEKIEEFFRAQQRALGLKGWLVWHADTLTAMLDANEEIRTRYAAWITEGDVLSAALQRLQRPSLMSVVPLALKRDLRKDRDVRRKDAGQITERKCFLRMFLWIYHLRRQGTKALKFYLNPRTTLPTRLREKKNILSMGPTTVSPIYPTKRLELSRRFC